MNLITEETRQEAHEKVDRFTRYKQILEIFSEHRTLTAKECAVMMMRRGLTPSDDRNFAAPRITELCKMGVLEAVGKVKCKYTGKTVALFTMR